MKLINVVLPPTHDLVLFGCTHEGSVLQYKQGVQKTIDYILKKENRYAAHLGDTIEAIAVDDPRYDPHTSNQPIPLLQADAAIEVLTPIKDRLLTVLLGNHEDKSTKFGNLSEYIAKALGVEYGTWTCKLIVKDDEGNIMYKVYLVHGFSKKHLSSNAKDYDQRIANLKAAMKMMLKEKASDCVLMAMAHYHLMLLAEPVNKLYLIDNGTELKQKYLTEVMKADYLDPDQRWYVCVGSYYKTYAMNIDSYAEKAGYDPRELGFMVAHVENKKMVSVKPMVV